MKKQKKNCGVTVLPLFLLAAFALCGASSGLELAYQAMPSFDGKVPVYTDDNLIFMVDIREYSTGDFINSADKDLLIAAVYTELVKQHPDLDLVHYGPLIYGEDGDVYSYIFEFRPKSAIS